MAGKIFEAGEVLPATTQLKISWENHSFPGGDYSYYLQTDNSGKTLIHVLDDFPMVRIIIRYGQPDQSPPLDGKTVKYYIIDTSTWSESERTISSVDSYFTDFTYEDLITGYTITFNSNGGTTIADIEEATELPNPLPTPTRDGYTFAGWYYDDDFTTQAYAEDELEDDVTLYAKWILNTYTITYNSNGGSIVPQTSNATQLPDPLPTTTRAGYTFVAWYYESNFKTRAVAGATIEANTTLYAKWHNLGSLFTEVADAIRSKDGTSENIRDVDFGERVKQIQGAKEEETKTVTPNFSSGNQVIEPTSGKVLSQITLTKPTDLIPENIAKDKNVCGVVGTSFIAVELTQAQYDALSTKDSNTYYLIVEE